MLLVLVPVGSVLRRVLGVLFHIILHSEAVLCYFPPFGMERVGGLHHFLEVVRVGNSTWSATLGCVHQFVTLALAILWFGGLNSVLLLILAWSIILFGGHRLFLIGI